MLSSCALYFSSVSCYEVPVQRPPRRRGPQQRDHVLRALHSFRIRTRPNAPSQRHTATNLASSRPPTPSGLAFSVLTNRTAIGLVQHPGN
jgi:hypothetical protein